MDLTSRRVVLFSASPSVWSVVQNRVPPSPLNRFVARRPLKWGKKKGGPLPSQRHLSEPGTCRAGTRSASACKGGGEWGLKKKSMRDRVLSAVAANAPVDPFLRLSSSKGKCNNACNTLFFLASASVRYLLASNNAQMIDYTT